MSIWPCSARTTNTVDASESPRNAIKRPPIKRRLRAIASDISVAVLKDVHNGRRPRAVADLFRASAVLLTAEVHVAGARLRIAHAGDRRREDAVAAQHAHLETGEAAALAGELAGRRNRGRERSQPLAVGRHRLDGRRRDGRLRPAGERDAAPARVEVGERLDVPIGELAQPCLNRVVVP